VPDAPSLLQAVALSSGSIDLSWQDNSDNELGFEIERKTRADGIYGRLELLDADVVSYRDTGLYETTTYY
jgi:titin